MDISCECLQFPCIVGVDFLKVNEVYLEVSSQAERINKENIIVPRQNKEEAFSIELSERTLTEIKNGEFVRFLKKFHFFILDTLGLTLVVCH